MPEDCRATGAGCGTRADSEGRTLLIEAIVIGTLIESNASADVSEIRLTVDRTAAGPRIDAPRAPAARSPGPRVRARARTEVSAHRSIRERPEEPEGSESAFEKLEP